MRTRDGLTSAWVGVSFGGGFPISFRSCPWVKMPRPIRVMKGLMQRPVA